ADTQAMAWARQMIPYVRSIDGGIPVTLSVSGSGGLSGLRALVAATRSTPLDFYTFHFYDPAALAYAAIGQAEQIVAPAPLFVGETGTSTCTCSHITGLAATRAAL